MDLSEVRKDVAAVDELVRFLVKSQAIDMNDPDWIAKLKAAPNPVDEAGVRVEADAALQALLDAYESGDAALRAEVREIFRAYPSFRDCAGLPNQWATAAEFRRRLLLISANDQGADPRDELISLWGLCHAGRELGIDTEPVLREVAELSSGVDHYGFGSMRALILRGLEVHDPSEWA
ncbi:hypothetical protein [Paractinoplanes durhamensis]|nr:hypothetical protein [Actinoplanes durhamensis]